MDSNPNQLRAKRPGERTRTRSRALTDDQLETLAVAFGSHLIRNAPPSRDHGMPGPRAVKLTRR